jgi:hypothetical protein
MLRPLVPPAQAGVAAKLHTAIHQKSASLFLLCAHPGEGEHPFEVAAFSQQCNPR